MKKLSFFLVVILLQINTLVFCQEKIPYDTINDGPYVFYINDSLKAISIEKGVEQKYYLSAENFAQINTILKLSCNYNDLLDVYSIKPENEQNYSNVDSVAAISDVHGQYDVYIKFLKNNGIIDENLNWKFGKGHFVFLGDAFDRGDKVTEILWHLFKLEKQAAKAGGAVHVIVGNHESMVLDDDLRYVNEKYLRVAEIFGISYQDLYSENSVLGKWLRSKPVMVSINDMLFVHAGASIELVRLSLLEEEINKLFYTNIFGKIAPLVTDIKKIDVLTGDDGPLWYRGYFEDKTFNDNKLDSILNFYNTKHIVVGHTTSKTIKKKFNYQIIGIDAGIGYGYSGELLIYKNGEYFRGLNTGRRIKL